MKHITTPWFLALASVLASPLAARQAPTSTDRAPVERSDWFARVSREIERAEYAFRPLGDAQGVWSAPNRSQGLRARVSSGGLEVFPRETDESGARAEWTLSIATTRFGRASNLHELSDATLTVNDARVELDHGLLLEWFTNDERGIEHGYTIAQRPHGTEPLWIGLDFGGDLSLRIDESGRSGVLVDACGEAQLRYQGLVVFDATGRELDARLASSPHGAGIEIDDAGALYPLTVDPLLTGPAWTAEGDQHDAAFGVSVASAGDVNGDGYSDVIVGAYLYDGGQTDEGRAFVYLGSSAGLAASAAWTAESEQTAAWFGLSASTAGDVNGDGYSDVIVGAYQYDNGELQEGRAFVYLGAASGLSTSPAWTAESDQAGALFGFPVATAGDVNGDGFSDVIIGATSYTGDKSEEGRAFVYLGSASGLSASAAWTAESNQAGSFFSAPAAAAGDVNGDGYGDVIVGASGFDNEQTDEGRAFVYLGSALGLEASAAWTAESNQTGAFFGHAVATAGDVNGDGYSDVIVGAREYTNGQTMEGRAYVYFGSAVGLSPSAAWTAESDQAFARFGYSVATAGDVNGDGYGDVIVGARVYANGESNEGRAFVYLGSQSGLAIGAAWTEECHQVGAQFGYSVATAGDVNGDGYSDVVVGAILYDNGEHNEGRAFVYHGSALGLATNHAWTAESDTAGAHFGTSVASAGDVNGDGFSDVIVGAPSYDGGTFDEGRAYAYLGGSAGLSTTAAWSFEGGASGLNFGSSVASAGDVNGDGYDDVIVGASNLNDKLGGNPYAFAFHGSPSGLAPNEAWVVMGGFASYFGTSVSRAGDVNGDGYGDVVVGAPGENRAYVYVGSSTGLATSAAGTLGVGEPYSFLGESVSTAGDVNGDGYSDVIVGGAYYSGEQINEGRALVYLGSAAGLASTFAWSAEGNQALARFGGSVSTAGDVNGDGFSDVIVGATSYDAGEVDEGRAFVYLGSAAGLALAPAWTSESNQANAYFGLVASAGDVNGDGYSDVIVGATSFTGDQTDEGRAFAYFGSSTGLASTPAWTAESDQSASGFGLVAPAGDVNGDGYGDVVVGANSYDAGQTNEGRAYVYLGNDGRGGWTRAARQRQANDAAPIALLGNSNDRRLFRIRLGFERALHGFAWASGVTPKARLEWEVAPLRSALDGSRIESGAEQTITGAPLTFNELVEATWSSGQALTFGATQRALVGARPFHWRARVRTNNPLFPVTPWVTLPGNNVSETKLRAGPRRGLRALD